MLMTNYFKLQSSRYLKRIFKRHIKGQSSLHTIGNLQVRLTNGTTTRPSLHISPASARKDSHLQPKLVLFYRPRKDKRPSWPDYKRVNNLLKVITRQKSHRWYLNLWPTEYKNRHANHSATAPQCEMFAAKTHRVPRIARCVCDPKHWGK